MKKSFLFFPFIALGLTACMTTSSSDVPPAADVTSAGIPDWQNPAIQASEMPMAMSQPSYQPAQPVYPSAQEQIQVNIRPKTEYIGTCQVVRDANNLPVYPQIQKGCYTDSAYTVGKYDTVFFVAYLSGKSVAEIAALNHLTQPYQLKMGQVLRLK